MSVDIKAVAPKPHVKLRYGDGRLKDNEIKSTEALISWSANQQKVSKELLDAMLKAHLQVDNINQIRVSDYDEVIKWLIDIRLSHVLN